MLDMPAAGSSAPTAPMPAAPAHHLAEPTGIDDSEIIIDQADQLALAWRGRYCRPARVEPQPVVGNDPDAGSRDSLQVREDVPPRPGVGNDDQLQRRVIRPFENAGDANPQDVDLAGGGNDAVTGGAGCGNLAHAMVIGNRAGGDRRREAALPRRRRRSAFSTDNFFPAAQRH
jgi:hypothetical protein